MLHGNGTAARTIEAVPCNPVALVLCQRGEKESRGHFGTFIIRHAQIDAGTPIDSFYFILIFYQFFKPGLDYAKRGLRSWGRQQERERATFWNPVACTASKLPTIDQGQSDFTGLDQLAAQDGCLARQTTGLNLPNPIQSGSQSCGGLHHPPGLIDRLSSPTHHTPLQRTHPAAQCTSHLPLTACKQASYCALNATCRSTKPPDPGVAH